MLFIGAIITSILAIQTMQTAISPAALKAMASLQAHRAKAIANVLRARAHYKALMARSNLGLLDHRVIRNSDDQFAEDPDFEIDEENFPFPDDDYEEINLPDIDENIARFLPVDFTLQRDQNGVEDLVGGNVDFAGTEGKMDSPGPDIPCAYSDFSENSSPDDLNMIQAPLHIGNIDQLREINMDYGTMSDSQIVQQRRQTTPLGCQRPFDQTTGLLENTPPKADPTVGMQAPFPAYATGQPQFGQQVPFFPWQFMPQGIPAMQMVPQMNPYTNFPLQPMPTLQPGPPMIFLRQASTHEEDKSKAHVPEKSSLDLTVSSSKQTSPDVGTSKHTHTHTHTHTLFKEPQSSDLIPNTHIVTPSLNLRVVQNQNSVVAPQQIPSATIQPGFNPTRGKFIPGGNVYSSNPTPSGYGMSQSQVFQINANGQRLIMPSIGGSYFTHSSQEIPRGYGTVGPGMSTAQSQFILTNAPNNKQYVLMPNTGTNFTHSQEMLQDGSPTIRMEFEYLPYSKLDKNYEQVGTVLTDSRMRAPESPEYFNPSRPQNLQPVVNYIERQQGNMKKLVQSIESNENLRHHFETPLDFNSEFGYVRSPNRYEGTENIQHENLGIFPLENIQINPPPTLPENFLQLNSEERQEAMDRYLQEEQANVKNFLEQVDENNRRSFDRLSRLVDVDPPFVANPGDFPKNSNIKENPNDFQSKMTGNWQYNTDPEVVNSPVIENGPGHQQMPNDVSSDINPNLGHIIEVPDKRESEWYQRLVRSLNKTTDDKLDNLLLTQKDIVKELKKDAKHDEDLMMIGYVGENMINDLEKRKNETNRPKRSIGGRPYDLPLNRLIADPRAALDIPRTLDNLGVAVKNTFEQENAPLYHVRNMVGSAQDAVLATMKIPTKNFLIPSQYDIVSRQGNNAILGDINPNLFSDKYSQNEVHPDNIANTFQKVGSAVRGSILSSQEALSHVGQVANHGKSAIHSTRYATPRLLLKQIPTVTRQPIRKAVLITPRILDVTNEGEQIGNVLDNSHGQFVKVGHILDAIGVSNPNYNDLRFEKIIVEPRRTVSMIHTQDKSQPSQMLANLLQNVRVEEFKEDQDTKFLRDTMSTLNKLKESLGVDNLKELFNKVNTVLGNIVPKEHVRIIEPAAMHQNSETNNPSIINRVGQQVNNHVHSFTTGNQVDQNQEVVQASMIPESLTHPFIGHFPRNEANDQQILNENERNKQLTQILGAINPVMFEKFFNESLKIENNSEMLQSIADEEVREKESNGEEVGTNMQFSEAMLRPFMGQASSKVKHDFFHKYSPDAARAEDESSEQEKLTEKPQWMEVDFNQGNGLKHEE